MAFPVYSTLFFAFNGTIEDVSSFTVPDGLVAVLRDVSGYATADAARGGTVVINANGVTVATFNLMPGGSRPLIWRGRTVVPATSTISVASGGSVDFIQVCASGYLLTLP